MKKIMLATMLALVFAAGAVTVLAFNAQPAMAECGSRGC
jgi:hypothetical protein